MQNKRYPEGLFSLSHFVSLLLARRTREKKRHIAFASFKYAVLRMLLGCSEIALIPLEVLPSIWKESKRVCEQQTYALTIPKQNVGTQASPNALPAFLSAVCEYPRKTSSAVKMGHTALHIYSGYQEQQQIRKTKVVKGYELFLISKDKFFASSLKGYLEISALSSKRSQ